MAERFVIRDLKSGEYLAEKFMRGTYFTNDISLAVKCKTKEDAQKKADKKYISKTYKRYAVNTRREFVPRIEQYMAKNGFESCSSYSCRLP